MKKAKTAPAKKAPNIFTAIVPNGKLTKLPIANRNIEPRAPPATTSKKLCITNLSLTKTLKIVQKTIQLLCQLLVRLVTFIYPFFHQIIKLLSQSPQKWDDQGKFQNGYRRLWAFLNAPDFVQFVKSNFDFHVV